MISSFTFSTCGSPCRTLALFENESLTTKSACFSKVLFKSPVFLRPVKTSLRQLLFVFHTMYILCAAEIVFNCEFVASVLLQMSIRFFRYRFLSCSSRFRVYLSRTPRTILSRRMEWRIQSQKLHVFASVRRAVT